MIWNLFGIWILEFGASRCCAPALTPCKRMVSDTISTPSPGCFSPFPHGTCSLSVSMRIESWPVVRPVSDGAVVPRPTQE